MGAVLAGGRSRRFGRDKALEPVEGVALAERVARVLADGLGVARADVVVVGAEVGPRVVTDELADSGPLGGVVSAWRALGVPLVVLACDLPRMDTDTVAWLAAPLSAGVEARVPLLGAREGESGPRRQWLAAHYGRAALEKLAAAWDAGERAMWRAAAGLVLEPVEAAGGNESPFSDADTPEALAALLSEARAG